MGINTMPDTDNGRVTLAILGEKIDSLKEMVQQSNEDTKEWRKEYSARLRRVEECTIEMRQNQSTTTKALGGFSLLLSAIAAWIRSRF